MGKGEHAYGPSNLIHSNVCGPNTFQSWLTRYKSKSFEKSREFKNEAKTQLRRSFQIT